MVHFKKSNFVILAAVGLLGFGAAGSAQAQIWAPVEWSGGAAINLGGLPGSYAIASGSDG